MDWKKSARISMKLQRYFWSIFIWLELNTILYPYLQVVNVIASIMGSYFVAIVYSVFFELPFQKLSDEFVLKRTPKK